jgi:hypothetical protein
MNVMIKHVVHNTKYTYSLHVNIHVLFPFSLRKVPEGLKERRYKIID